MVYGSVSHSVIVGIFSIRGNGYYILQKPVQISLLNMKSF